MRKALLILVVAALALAGCGSKGGSGGSASASGSGVDANADKPIALEGSLNNHGTASVSGGKIEIEQDDFYFNPTFVKAEAGATVTVELKNEGKATHTFTIDALDIDETVQPGATKEVEVKVPSDHAVRFYCRFHAGQGMQGAIFTKTGQELASASTTSDPSGSDSYGY